MIVEQTFGFALNIIQLIFSGFQIINLPLELMSALLDFLCYGVWVVGADLMGIFISTVAAVYAFKFSAGLLLFIYRLIPLI